MRYFDLLRIFSLLELVCDLSTHRMLVLELSNMIEKNVVQRENHLGY